MSSDRYLGNYLAIVVQNNDPEKRGRVKVFVPHISANIYADWNQNKLDKNFAFVDSVNNPDFDKIMPYLKKSLPWAEIAGPIFGGSASGRYNAIKKSGTTSDSNYWDGDNYVEGFRPLQAFTNENKVADAFTEIVPDKGGSRFVNPNAFQYQPSDYSNLARGTFSPINVGAHVWVFFENGDPTFPVVLAVSHGDEDWKRIYSQNKDSSESPADFISEDYPESYENLTTTEQGKIDHNTKTFRSKHVLNSNKHTLEFVDTDLKEILKMTHYSGSFLEFTNSTVSMLATNNDQKLVLGDQFLTVRKNQAIWVANYQETNIMGDRITNIGNFVTRRTISKQIYDILKDTHEYKRLFETQRTGSNPPYTSGLQSQDGEPADCPVCGGAGLKFNIACITCGGSGVSPSTQDGDYTEKDDEEVVKKIIENQKLISEAQYEAKFGNGGDDICIVTGNRIVTIGTMFNDLESYRVDPVGKIRDHRAYIGQSGTYYAMHAAPLVEYVDVDSMPGGDYSLTVCNNYKLTVGSKGIHIKTTGPIDMYGTIVNLTGESINISSQWEVQIDGGKRLELRADVINIKPHGEADSCIGLDGNVGIRDNLTVVGGAYVEGEVMFQHMTTPMQMYQTDVGYGPLPHVHNFYGPPWTLLETCEDVRSAAQTINEATPAPNMKCPGFWVPS